MGPFLLYPWLFSEDLDAEMNDIHNYVSISVESPEIKNHCVFVVCLLWWQR